jgi:hypothetical protein
MPTQDSVDPIMKKRVMNGAEYAYVRIEGEFHSLGRWGTRDSIARFEKVLAEWRATIIGREQPTDRILTVGELAENYLQHETDRRDAGEVTRSTWYAARNAMLVLVESHAGTPAVRFGPTRKVEESRGHPPTWFFAAPAGFPRIRGYPRRRGFDRGKTATPTPRKRMRSLPP